jgi:hypothetical protein
VARLSGFGADGELVSVVMASVTAFVTFRLFVSSRVEDATKETRTSTESAKTVVLEGTAEVRWGEEVEVFYKRPFASPPYLTFSGGLDGTCHVVDQKAMSFKLKRDNAGQAGGQFPKVMWKAEGPPTS